MASESGPAGTGVMPCMLVCNKCHGLRSGHLAASRAEGAVQRQQEGSPREALVLHTPTASGEGHMRLTDAEYPHTRSNGTASLSPPSAFLSFCLSSPPSLSRPPCELLLTLLTLNSPPFLLHPSPSLPLSYLSLCCSVYLHLICCGDRRYIQTGISHLCKPYIYHQGVH